MVGARFEFFEQLRAKVSGGSFYTYFSGPEAVMEALALRFMEEVNSTADFLGKRSLAAERCLRQKVRSAYQYVTPNFEPARP